MKKATAFLSAFLILLSAVSCSKKENSSILKQDKSLIAPSESLIPTRLDGIVYKKEQIKLPADIKNGYYMSPFEKSNKYLVFGSNVDFELKWYITDKDFSGFEEFDIPGFDIGTNYNLALADNGTIVTFLVHIDDEESEKYSYMINSYSMEGQLISSVPVDENFGNIPDKYSSIGTMCTDGKFLIVEIDGTYELFGIDGKYYGDLRNDDIMVSGIGTDSNGNIVCAVESENDNIMFCRLDENGKLMQTDKAYAMTDTIIGGIIPGSENYDIFLRTTSAIYGIRSDNSEMEMLFDITASETASNDIQGYSMCKDGNFTLFIYDYQNPLELAKFIPKTADEIDDTPVLTIGYCAGEGQDIGFNSDNIKPWNSDNSHDFQVKLKFYKDDYENHEIFDTIAKDMISGELPDVLFLDGDGFFGNVNMLEKNATCDLYEFMDKDEIYKRDFFVDNALKCLEHDGKLTAITDRFYINMGTCAKKKFVSDAENWSIDKMLDIIINPPIEIELPDTDSKVNRSCGQYSISGLSWHDWVDVNNGTCDFNSDSFIRFLKFCNEAPVVDIDWSTYEEPTAGMTESEKTDYHNEKTRLKNLAYIEDRNIFSDTICIGAYDNYAIDIRGQFGGEEMTFIDEPEISALDKLMAINADSDKKEMAWEFIKSYFNIERYENANYCNESGMHLTGGFPVTKDGLKYDENFARTTYYPDYSKADITKDDPDWKDYKGLVYQVDYEDYSYNIKLGELTDDDVNAVNDIIGRMKPGNYINLLDQQFYEIADEEMLNFFYGRCTAEQCADSMQNRLSIYLSEIYS